MSNKETVKKYFNKYFKAQYFKESDHEFKSLERILNKKDKQVKNLNIPCVINWVAVSEKKPPIDTWVLIAHDKDKWTDRGELSKIGFFYNSEVEVYPTHWAKLPEPPCL